MIKLNQSFPSHILSLRSGVSCPGDAELACGQDSVLLYLNQETSYYILIDGYGAYDAGVYVLNVYNADCYYDMELTAPGAVSGNICYAHNDCDIESGNDQLVQVTIPHDGVWTLSLCDGQPWTAHMYLMQGCCHDQLNITAGYCAETEQTGRAAFHNIYLAQGVHYVDIESAFIRCGPWTLTASEYICETRPSNDDCGAITPVSLPATFTGNNACATPECELIEYYGDEVWHAFTLDSLSDVYVDYCGTSDSINAIMPILVWGCPCNNYFWTDYQSFYPCGDETVLRLFYPSMPAGTWYLPRCGIRLV